MADIINKGETQFIKYKPANSDGSVSNQRIIKLKMFFTFD